MNQENVGVMDINFRYLNRETILDLYHKAEAAL